MTETSVPVGTPAISPRRQPWEHKPNDAHEPRQGRQREPRLIAHRISHLCWRNTMGSVFRCHPYRGSGPARPYSHGSRRGLIAHAPTGAIQMSLVSRPGSIAQDLDTDVGQPLETLEEATA